jgi:transcriptional regulator with XRE-family HTH domain
VSNATLYSYSDIARAIRLARRQRGWTQAQLAAAANVSPSVVAKLEESKGKTVTLDTVFALLRALSIDVQLVSRKGSPISFEDLEVGI